MRKLFCILFAVSALWSGWGNTAIAGTATIESNRLAVEVDTAFPRIVVHLWKSSGAKLDGQPKPVSVVRINGEEYTPDVTLGHRAETSRSSARIGVLRVEFR